MKKFLIKVNGNRYEVEVEELRDGFPTVPTASIPITAASTPVAVTTPAAQAKAPAAAPMSPAAATAAVNGATGTVKITAPMPGTILKISANVGDIVKKNQVLIILEAMKMENEIVASSEGIVASINVSMGSSVNTGDLLVSLD